MRFAARQGGKHSRKFNPKYRTASLSVVAQNFPGVFLNDAEADAEAETRALADRFGSVKGVEHAGGILDARTGIRKKNNNIAERE